MGLLVFTGVYKVSEKIRYYLFPPAALVGILGVEG